MSEEENKNNVYIDDKILSLLEAIGCIIGKTKEEFLEEILSSYFDALFGGRIKVEAKIKEQKENKEIKKLNDALAPLDLEIGKNIKCKETARRVYEACGENDEIFREIFSVAKESWKSDAKRFAACVIEDLADFIIPHYNDKNYDHDRMVHQLKTHAQDVSFKTPAHNTFGERTLTIYNIGADFANHCSSELIDIEDYNI